MDPDQVNSLEVELLLETLHRRYGYDFRDYTRSSIERSIADHVQRSQVRSPSELIPKIIHDRRVFELLVRDLSVTVSTMFRDPPVFDYLRQEVFPWLRTHPFFRIWHAGCANGEEVYALAILLKEANLYDRATIFATDFNDEALNTAMQGVYPIDNARTYTEDYLKSGGSRSFSEYYHAYGDHIHMNRTLRENITFANHNLATDEVFTEAHLILCRNVLIYFGSDLRSRSLRIFRESLTTGGFLCLGRGELLVDANQMGFTPYYSECALYKKFESTSPRHTTLTTESGPITS